MADAELCAQGPRPDAAFQGAFRLISVAVAIGRRREGWLTIDRKSGSAYYARNNSRSIIA
jgi:hypothetical protein